MKGQGEATKPGEGRGYLIIYALLSLAVVGPLLLSGYVLALDMLQGPWEDPLGRLFGLNQWWVSPAAPFSLLLTATSSFIPPWVWQKVIFFLIFFLAGVGAHRLIHGPWPGRYYAGLLYAINPFTYVRFLAGQWWVLMGYALAPFALKAFIDLLDLSARRSDRGHLLRQGLKLSLLFTLAGLFYAHGLFLLLLAFIILILVRLASSGEGWRNLSPAIPYLGISAIVALGLNFYWLFPLAWGGETLLGQIGTKDMLFFAPHPSSPQGVAFDLASMYGFWRGGYLHIRYLLPLWWLLPAFILFLAVYGLTSGWSQARGRWVAVGIAWIGGVSLFLAVGAASQLTQPAFGWIWSNLPLFQGFRDSQKFVGLLVLAYAFLGGLGMVDFLRERLKYAHWRRTGMSALMVVAFLVPLAYSFPLFGFHGQLRVTDFPPSWQEVNEHLKKDSDDFNVLFLPWHQYMDYSWLPNRDRKLGNPAHAFFARPVIAGDNIEVPGIPTQSTNPISKYVEFLLERKDKIANLGELLAPLNVKYVILVQEADYAEYAFLYRQPELRVEMERPGITLFRNLHSRARVYGVDSLVYISSLEEYLKLSQTQEVMEHLYVLGEGENQGQSSPMEAIKYEKRSPVAYEIEAPSRHWFIFTVPQEVSTRHWAYRGQTSLANLGFMPAFLVAGSGEVVYSRFYQVYLPGYIVSGLVLVAILGAYWWGGHIGRIPKKGSKEGGRGYGQ